MSSVSTPPSIPAPGSRRGESVLRRSSATRKWTLDEVAIYTRILLQILLVHGVVVGGLFASNIPLLSKFLQQKERPSPTQSRQSFTRRHGTALRLVSLNEEVLSVLGTSESNWKLQPEAAATAFCSFIVRAKSVLVCEVGHRTRKSLSRSLHCHEDTSLQGLKSCISPNKSFLYNHTFRVPLIS